MNGLRIIWESFGNHLHHHDTKPTYIHRTVQVQSQLFDSSTKSHTETMITPALQSKIDKSIQLIRKAERTALRYRAEGFFVAFSGGKDSQVLLKLTQLADVKFTSEHRLTTIDPPENVKFIREHYPDVRIVRPVKSFWRLCTHHKMLPTQWCRFCCKELKEASNEHAVTLTGVRRSESARRSSRQEVFLQTRRRHPEFTQGSFDQFTRYQESTVECLKGKDKLTVNPILDWSEQDVWDFIHHYNLPVNPLYERGYRRVGCICCPMSNIKSIRREVEDYPKYYEAFLRLIRKIRTIKRATPEGDIWEDCTDEEVFWAWAQKQGPEKTKAAKHQLSIEFPL